MFLDLMFFKAETVFKVFKTYFKKFKLQNFFDTILVKSLLPPGCNEHLICQVIWAIIA